METAPDSPATGNTVMISLWSSNMQALRCERTFAYAVGCQGAVASLIRFVPKSVVVADHRTAIVSAEELVQRANDLALTDVKLAGQINVTERAPSRSDRIF
jgi:hypothetical protein